MADDGNKTWTGVLLNLLVFELIPNFPSALHPWVNTSPSVFMNAICFYPQDNVFIWYGICICFGILWLLCVPVNPIWPYVSDPHA